MGAITAGLNHGLHSGLFGRNAAIAALTGRLRHLWGPDAGIISGTATVSAGGAAKVQRMSKSMIKVKDQEYHYKMRENSNMENILRNVATLLGEPVGLTNGLDYMIHYKNPLIPIFKINVYRNFFGYKIYQRSYLGVK
ncbi:MAG: hypothetical protein ACR2MS_06875 [Weeksellaceae bacterium]